MGEDSTQPSQSFGVRRAGSQGCIGRGQRKQEIERYGSAGRLGSVERGRLTLTGDENVYTLQSSKIRYVDLNFPVFFSRSLIYIDFDHGFAQ